MYFSSAEIQNLTIGTFSQGTKKPCSFMFLMVIGFFLIFMSCKHSSYSEVKIVNGTSVDCNAEELCNSTVAILVPKGSTKEIVCTGSVLASNLVLTAAHCFHHVKVDKVYIGYGEDPLENKIYEVSSIAYPHEYWSPEPGEMNELLDVAILVLEERLEPKMVPATIYSKHKVESGIMSNLGYGFRSENFEDDSKNNYGILSIGFPRIIDEMQYKAPPFIDSLKYPSDYRFIVDSQPSSTAPGDSGGPLFIKEGDGKSYLIGPLRGSTINRKLVNGEYIETKLGNYTRVAYFTKWIEKLMLQENSKETLQQYGNLDERLQFVPNAPENFVGIEHLFAFNRKLCQRWDGWDFLPSMDECFPATRQACEEYSRRTGGNLIWDAGSNRCIFKE